MGKVAAPPKPIIQTDADPTVTRIIPKLAKEIGLNESIVLLQIAFWIKQANHLQDGQWWTYQSIREMQRKAFPYWSVPTINRIINKLVKQSYLVMTDTYNQKAYDKTRWFALNVAKLQELQNISLKFEAVGLLQNETPLLQNETPPTREVFQNETTIPENKTEITTEREEAPLTPQIENGGAKAEPLPTATRIVTPELAAAGGLDMKVAAALGLLNPDPILPTNPDRTAFTLKHPLYAGWRRAHRDKKLDEPTTFDRKGELWAALNETDFIERGYTEDDAYQLTTERLNERKIYRFKYVLEDLAEWRNKRKFDAAAAADAHLQKFVSTNAATNTRADDYFDPTKFKKPEVTP